MTVQATCVGRVFPGGVLTKCAALVPLGGPLVVGMSARPYFTRQAEMVHLLQHLRTYCEEHWARKHTMCLCLGFLG